MATDAPYPADSLPEVIEESASSSSMRREPMRRRDFMVLAAWTACADFLIFRTLGYSGPAVFFAFAPLLFLVGRGLERKLPTLFVVSLLLLSAIRLVWLGSALTTTGAIALLFATALVASGHYPTVLECAVLAMRSMFDGLAWASRHRLPRWFGGSVPTVPNNVGAWALPMLAAVVFGGIFVFANPDLLKVFSDRFTIVFDWIGNWFGGISALEIPFCIAALFVGAGLLKPVFNLIGPSDQPATTTERQPALLFAGFRNTLITLSVLYVVYLAFEFTTLWGRDFPPGFYYAGYAHQGAAWLTFALMLATALLSLVFSGKTLLDPRLGQLRGLAWTWSILNFLLAAAVYNRLAIYVGYNGMTRLRTVGFFGTTAVVLGFALVLYKIARQRGFWWLLRAQLMALAITIIAYGLFPVDYVAHTYNAKQVARGYSHPAVMIAVKPINDEGVLPLLGLVDDAQDPIIREGVRAMLAKRQLEIERFSAAKWHWSKFQGATHVLYQHLSEKQSKWQTYIQDPAAREDAINQFQAYAMQWY